MEVTIAVIIALSVICWILSGVAMYKRNEPAIIWSVYAAIVLTVLIPALTWQKRVWDHKKTQEVFALAIEVVFGMETRTLQSHLLATYGNPAVPLVSPVHRMLFLRVENRQPFPVMIDSYTVEAKKGDRWIRLNRIDSRFIQFYFADNDLRVAHRIDLSQNGLDFLIDNRMLVPRIPVRGWCLFELPEDISIHSDYRVRVHDTGGAEAAQELPQPNANIDSVLGAAWQFAEDADISNRRFVYWSEANKQRKPN